MAWFPSINLKALSATHAPSRSTREIGSPSATPAEPGKQHRSNKNTERANQRGLAPLNRTCTARSARVRNNQQYRGTLGHSRTSRDRYCWFFLTEAAAFLAEDDESKKPWIDRRARLVRGSDGDRKRSANSPEGERGKRKRPVLLPLPTLPTDLITGNRQKPRNHAVVPVEHDDPTSIPDTVPDTPRSSPISSGSGELFSSSDSTPSPGPLRRARRSTDLRHVGSERVPERHGNVQRQPEQNVPLERLPISVPKLERSGPVQEQERVPAKDYESAVGGVQNDLQSASVLSPDLRCSETLSDPNDGLPVSNSTGPDPDTGTRPIDLAHLRDCQLSWDNYDFMLDKAYGAVRRWWHQNGSHLKMVLRELDQHLPGYVRCATLILRQQIHESENGYRLLHNLKLRGELYDHSLDFLINGGMLWRDNTGQGGMRWCMNTLDRELPGLVNRCRVQRPVADDEATATGAGK
uniref:Uncharacterized protein n=1 Tax=Parvoviridae sp. TaxID=1940570 RepID=A0A7D3UWA2_9VIRU|nr:MAG: hypothetical protein [Parvoviridae sp.]